MSCLSKGLPSILILTMVVSSLSMTTIQPVSAQSIPTPSVPEFTVKYVNDSYYVPPQYAVDQYSGKTVQTGGGFALDNETIVITITPQPFTSYRDKDGNAINLLYNVEYKGNFGQTWMEDGVSHGDIVVFGLGDDGYDENVGLPFVALGDLSAGDQVDFRVQAQIGYYNYTYSGVGSPDIASSYYIVFIGKTSDWSNIQTITIPGDSASIYTSPDSLSAQAALVPTQTPFVPEFTALAILPLLLSLFAVAVLLRHRKNDNPNTQSRRSFTYE